MEQARGAVPEASSSVGVDICQSLLQSGSSKHTGLQGKAEPSSSLFANGI